ncbi:IS66 family transposase, partial [Pseudomonas syringae]|uniref:IS66 family transposase n=1 Tax=Pseudomonas syringae TaxID=317 RepID=UPI001CA9B1FF
VMTDDYAGYNALGAQAGVERLGCWAHARRKFVDAQKVQPKGKTGRADIALNLINKLYGIERAIRPFVIGRKNWLFSDTPKGATASAQLYSVV